MYFPIFSQRFPTFWRLSLIIIVFCSPLLDLLGLAEANLAGRFAASMACDRPTIDAENLLESLLTMKRSSIASQLKPAERNLATT